MVMREQDKFNWVNLQRKRHPKRIDARTEAARLCAKENCNFIILKAFEITKPVIGTIVEALK